MKVEFSELANEAIAVCGWLEGIGLNVSPTRVGRYREKLQLIVRYLAEDTPEKINEDLEPYLQALFEFAELSVLHQAFSENMPIGVENVLEKLVSGPFSYIDEAGNSGKARNFAFEASLGARMCMAGLVVSYKYTGDVFTDSTGIPLYFQCKRISSVKKLKSRLKQAADQLRRDFQQHPGSMSHGFIALDITKVTNPDGQTMIADNSAEVAAQNTRFRTAFIQQYIQGLRISGPKKIIGIVVRNAYLCFDKESQSYVFDQGYTTANMGTNSEQQHLLANTFHDALQRGSVPCRLIG